MFRSIFRQDYNIDRVVFPESQTERTQISWSPIHLIHKFPPATPRNRSTRPLPVWLDNHIYETLLTIKKVDLNANLNSLRATRILIYRNDRMPYLRSAGIQ